MKMRDEKNRLREKGTSKMKICDYSKKILNQWIKHLFIYV